MDLLPYQKIVFKHVLNNRSGLICSPTGTGKTIAIWGPILAQLSKRSKSSDGVFVVWIAPIKALITSLQKALYDYNPFGVQLNIVVKTGDQPLSVKKLVGKNSPHVLITTPESLHLILATKEGNQVFKQLGFIVVDEWHDLLGSKRGTQTELAIAWLKMLKNDIRIWGLSATIGDPEYALNVLLGNDLKGVVVKSHAEKATKVALIAPRAIEKYPWSGHLGLHIKNELYNTIKKYKSILVFTNTRAQSEIWYHTMLEHYPTLAGRMAIHHSAIAKEQRTWIENALNEGILQLVFCTSSLDLGVDLQPVEAVVQVGSPKHISRFIQRAGRSGHNPFDNPLIYFLPTNALEILDYIALKRALAHNVLEKKSAVLEPFDVLLQFMVTLSCGEGFDQNILLKVLKTTYAYEEITSYRFQKALNFLAYGGNSLNQYIENHRIKYTEYSKWVVSNRKIAAIHRLNIGTILGTEMVQVKLKNGKILGQVESYFANSLKDGDVFFFAGQNLERIWLKDLSLLVRITEKPAVMVNRFMGGKMALSDALGAQIQHVVDDIAHGFVSDETLELLLPILDKQKQLSHFPESSKLLIEIVQKPKQTHFFFYFFGGRLIHEALAALCGLRLSRITKMNFSIGINEYGFELCSAFPVTYNDSDFEKLFSLERLESDLKEGLNLSDLAKKQFREVARIANLTPIKYPGKETSNRNFRMNANLLFEVFSTYEPDHPLLLQAFDQLNIEQLQTQRLALLLNTIVQRKLVVHRMETFSPFSFPILTERMKSNFTAMTYAEQVQMFQKWVEN